MGLGRVTSINYSHGPTQNQHKVVGARTNHGQTRTHKTHHNSELGEATTFPLIVYFVLLHEATSKWLFILGLPSGSPEIAKIGILATLGPHNFVCKPLIEMRSEIKL